MIEIPPGVDQVLAIGARVWLLMDDGVTMVDAGLPATPAAVYAEHLDRTRGRIRRLDEVELAPVALSHFRPLIGDAHDRLRALATRRKAA